MRILMTADTVGGVWTYTRELVLGLLDADESVSIVLVTLGNLPTEEQASWMRSVAGQYRKRFVSEPTNLPLEWQQDNTKAYIYAEPMLRRIANTFAVDLLHTNQFCFGALPLECPRVVVAHSDVLSWHRAVRGVLPEDSAWLDTYREIVAAGLAGASTIVGPSYDALTDLQIGFGKFTGTRMISNGRSIAAPRAAKNLQAVTAGRVWDEAKGMTVLENLLSPMPIFIAGGTASPDRSYSSERLLRRTILGRLSEERLLEVFAESAIYLITSLYEPFGLAAVEAALCGCAVIARDIPSQREIWADAATYFTDAESLCTALERLAKKEDRLYEAQRRAVERARERYTRDRMAADYLRLYRELLAR